MSPRPRPEPSPALREILAADEARGVDVFAVEHTTAAPPPAGPPLIIEPFDTSSFVPVREPDPALHSEDEQARPARRASRWRGGDRS